MGQSFSWVSALSLTGLSHFSDEGRGTNWIGSNEQIPQDLQDSLVRSQTAVHSLLHSGIKLGHLG